MPSFQYQSLTATGETRTGVLSAADRAEALRLLGSRGETPLRLGPLESGGASSPAAAAGLAGPAALAEKRVFSFKARRPSLGRADLANFIRELATALEAGLPLMQALVTVRRQAHGKAMPVILDHLIDRVEAGDPLYLAARTYGLPFDDMVVGMLRAADASGEMSRVMHQLADLLERSVELRREVLGATFYPMIVASLIIISVIILVTVLVPRLIEPLSANPNFVMPWPTKTILGIAAFLQSYWIHCIVGIGAIWVGWRVWSSSPTNRYHIDRMKLQAPLLGRLLRDVAVARFTRTLGTLLTSGMPILDSLRITRNTLGNAALARAIDEVQDQVTSGKAVADPLERSGLFPPLLVQVVDLGERSGRLDAMLVHAATAFDRQVNTSIKLFSKALPPVLLIIMACLVGFVLSAILLPLLDMQSLVEG
jgi:type II secretory pathway component PulF